MYTVGKEWWSSTSFGIEPRCQGYEMIKVPVS